MMSSGVWDCKSGSTLRAVLTGNIEWTDSADIREDK